MIVVSKDGSQRKMNINYIDYMLGFTRESQLKKLLKEVGNASLACRWWGVTPRRRLATQCLLPFGSISPAVLSLTSPALVSLYYSSTSTASLNELHLTHPGR